MTRSVTIVNTSNCDNEPCLVNGILLQAGEMIVLESEKAQDVKVTPIKALTPIRPFGRKNSNVGEGRVQQVLPEVHVEWKDAEGGSMLCPEDTCTMLDYAGV